MDKRTSTAALLVVAGVAALLLGTLTHAWWSAGHGDDFLGLGLREVKLCSSGLHGCETSTYSELFDKGPPSGSHAAFVMTGNMCFFGAFIAVAAALGALGALLAKKQLPFPLARVGVLLSLMLLAGALAFVMTKPTEGMGGLSTGYGTICYMGGLFLLLVGGQQVSKLSKPPEQPGEIPHL